HALVHLHPAGVKRLAAQAAQFGIGKAAQDLPADNLPQVRQILGGSSNPELRRLGRKALDAGWVKMDKRVFDNAKVSDHSAIIPTGEDPRNLDEAHYKVYDMVVKRLLAVFYPPARFEVTTRLTVVAEETFKTEGKVLVDAGWLE